MTVFPPFSEGHEGLTCKVVKRKTRLACAKKGKAKTAGTVSLYFLILLASHFSPPVTLKTTAIGAWESWGSQGRGTCPRSHSWLMVELGFTYMSNTKVNALLLLLFKIWSPAPIHLLYFLPKQRALLTKQGLDFTVHLEFTAKTVNAQGMPFYKYYSASEQSQHGGWFLLCAPMTTQSRVKVNIFSSCPVGF